MSVAVALAGLEARRDAICAELAALSATAAGGLPNTSGSNNVDHVGYKDGLYRELREINSQIAILTGPAEVVTYGVV